MSGVVSRWLGGIAALDDIAQRLVRVQVENRPAIDVMQGFTTPPAHCFIVTRPICTRHAGMQKHTDLKWMSPNTVSLRRLLNKCLGKVAVSGYEHALMDELFPAARWFKTLGEDKTIHSTKGNRREVLWTNFKPTKLRQVSMFAVTPQTPEQILQDIYDRAAATLEESVVTDKTTRERVDYVCRCMSNRAGVRLLMSCLWGNWIIRKLTRANPTPRLAGLTVFRAGLTTSTTLPDLSVSIVCRAIRRPRF